MSPEPAIDILGIGNAIVDVLAHTDDGALADLGLHKGTMSLIDGDRVPAIYASMAPGVECSGGSAANTVAGAALLGARTAFIGKVKDDTLGHIFRHDIRSAGVAFDTPPAADGSATACCLVMVTPDAHRTMATHLGACVELGPEAVDPDLVRAAAVTYVEGYLWDPPRARDAVRLAVRTAREAGRRVALSLSDPFCVDRHRDELRELVERDVDLLFANEEEIVSLFCARDFDDALQHVHGAVEVAALTRSEKGSVVVNGGEVHVIDAEPVARVVDTTGAGDLYAAGFLAAWVRGADLGTCARAGGVCAAEVITHLGARPEGDLRALVAARVGEGVLAGAR
ncbi:MAG: adenosine kinase [Thermoleophilia bacterium]|jgi:sugar/nucleoside kinase (ribokinase family)|nr:adenosine kinase [Thermoleophilia bacterium]